MKNCDNIYIHKLPSALARFSQCIIIHVCLSRFCACVFMSTFQPYVHVYRFENRFLHGVAVTLATVVNTFSTTAAALEMVKAREGIHEWADSRKFSLHTFSVFKDAVLLTDLLFSHVLIAYCRAHVY